MKQNNTTPAVANEPKLQLVYSSKHELAAVHLITPNGIISYASLGTVPKPKKQAS
ncbi:MULTISPECIES: hypothetical protein [Chitinophagaceae]|uniref:hypothetical protein n=1 Tax=Chitinophagaceae TaxID=563835 RepID=UPI0012D72B53|nr:MULTISPECIES: hypothetical protein [Chitinophagaceae]